jgi:DNA-binding transcriptional MerR regulator
MAELVRATGVPKSTLLYYVAEALLPEPERPKPNVALYDPVCVDLVRYIRAAQQIHRYPLAWIRNNIKYILAGVPPEDVLHLGERLLGKPTAMFSKEEAARESGVEPADLDRYVDAGLVWPTESGRFDEYDVRMARRLAFAEESGIPADALVRVADALRVVEEAASQVADEYVVRNARADRAAVLVEVLGGLYPYLMRRFTENRAPW